VLASMVSIPEFYGWFLVASLSLATVFLGYCLWSRERRGALPLALGFVGVIFWLVGDIIQLTDLDSVTPFVGLDFVPLGADFASLGVLLFALEYTGRDHLITRKTLGVLAIKPVITLSVLLSPLRVYLTDVSTLETVAVDPGNPLAPLLAAHALYNWAIAILGIALLVGMMAKAEVGYRRQLPAVLVAFLTPLILNVMFHAGPVPFNPTSASFLVSSTALMYASFRLRLMDAVPIARREVLEQMTDMVSLLDENGRIVTINGSAEEVFGESREVSGTYISELLDDEVPSDPDEETEGSIDTTVTIDGEEYHLTVTRTLLTDYRGNLLGQLLVCRDVTERIQREHKLQRQNERLDRFASFISHDLRNPLNAAIGSTKLAERTDEPENFEAVRESLERMEDMIDDMMSLARAETTVEETEELEIGTQAHVAWETSDTGDATLETDAPDSETIEGDPHLLRSILENLFRNSIDHNDSEVTVTVGLLNDREGFYVQDDGDGVPEEERDDVFEYGYTTTSEGAGLGLAIVKDLVEAHGWDVRVTEGSEGGARFEFRTGGGFDEG